MVKEMVKVLFPATKNLDEVVGIIEKYRMKFGLNTGMRLAQFLAQVREEVGPEFKVVRESLNYHEDALTKVYKAFNKELAEKYGRDEGKKANQEAIANIAYANKLGNGNADSDGDGDMDADDDGYKYRGAGCLQITGKGNFTEVQKRCVRYAGKEMDPDTLEGFIVFGMSFWVWKDLYNQADTGDTDRVTAVINKYTDSYERRKEHFKKIEHLVV
jgi:putative chitinase